MRQAAFVKSLLHELPIDLCTHIFIALPNLSHFRSYLIEEAISTDEALKVHHLDEPINECAEWDTRPPH